MTHTQSASLTTSFNGLSPQEKSHKRRKEGKMNIQAYEADGDGGHREKLWCSRWSHSREQGAGSALLHRKQEKGGDQGRLESWIFSTADPVGFCPAKVVSQNHKHAHKHKTLSRARSLNTVYQRPQHTGIDFWSWQHEKEKMLCLFPSVLLWDEVRVYCVWRLCCIPQDAATVCLWHICLLSWQELHIVYQYLTFSSLILLQIQSYASKCLKAEQIKRDTHLLLIPYVASQELIGCSLRGKVRGGSFTLLCKM